MISFKKKLLLEKNLNQIKSNDENIGLGNLIYRNPQNNQEKTNQS